MELGTTDTTAQGGNDEGVQVRRRSSRYGDAGGGQGGGAPAAVGDMDGVEPTQTRVGAESADAAAAAAAAGAAAGEGVEEAAGLAPMETEEAAGPVEGMDSAGSGSGAASGAGSSSGGGGSGSGNGSGSGGGSGSGSGSGSGEDEGPRALSAADIGVIDAVIEECVNHGECPHPGCGWRSNAASPRDQRKSALKHMRTETVHDAHFEAHNDSGFLCPVCWSMYIEGEFSKDTLKALYPALLAKGPPSPAAIQAWVKSQPERKPSSGLGGDGQDKPRPRKKNRPAVVEPDDDDDEEESSEEEEDKDYVCPHDHCEWRPKSARAAASKVQRHAESLEVHRHHLNECHETCETCKTLIAQGKWEAPAMIKEQELREPSPDTWDRARARIRNYDLYRQRKRPRLVYELDALPSDVIGRSKPAKKQGTLASEQTGSSTGSDAGTADLAAADPAADPHATTRITPLMATRAMSPTFEFTGYHDNRATESTVVQEMGLLRRDLARAVTDTTRTKVTALRALSDSVSCLNNEVISLKSTIQWAVVKPIPEPAPEEAKPASPAGPTGPTPPAAAASPESQGQADPPAQDADAPPQPAVDIDTLPPNQQRSLFWETFTNQLLHDIAVDLELPLVKSAGAAVSRT